MHLKEVQFFCDDHVDKSLMGWWLTVDRCFKCDKCNNLSTWICVDVAAEKQRSYPSPNSDNKQPE